MSDVTEKVDEKKKKLKMGDPMKSPGSFGAFGGLFILQGLISLVWGMTKNSLELLELRTADQLTALSTQSISEDLICLYGIVCIIGGILMIGLESILEAIKPSGRKPTLKGWIASIVGMGILSFGLMLPLIIIFLLIKH